MCCCLRWSVPCQKTGLSTSTLQWRHNEPDGFSNHKPHDCLLNRLFGRRSKKRSKPRVTGLCAGNSPVTGEFPAQRASNAEMFPFDDVIMMDTYMMTFRGLALIKLWIILVPESVFKLNIIPDYGLHISMRVLSSREWGYLQYFEVETLLINWRNHYTPNNRIFQDVYNISLFKVLIIPSNMVALILDLSKYFVS